MTWKGLPQMNAGVEQLQAVLARAAQADQEVNLHALLGRMTMEVVGTTAFGCAAREAGACGRCSKFLCRSHHGVTSTSQAATHKSS